MNKPLLSVFMVVAAMAGLFSPGRLAAQCNCPNGEPASTIVHSVQLDSVTLTTQIPIPRFTASLGTLICVGLSSTITSVMSFDLTNRISEDFTYNMRSNLTASISGPGGLSNSQNSTANYGPYDLGPYMGGSDFVQYGPGTIFNNLLDQHTINANVTPYIGTGNVNLTYDLSGPIWAQPSSGNYGLEVRTYSNINLELTYSWCDHTAMAAANIRDFTVSKTNQNTIGLKWSVPNDKHSNSYEIQLSHDGRTFKSVGQRTSNAVAEGAATEYLYQHTLDKPVSGKAYFRIRQQQAGNSFSYSGIKSVMLGNDPAASLSIYPNPAGRSFRLNFDEALTGDYQVRLTNQVGQLVHNSRVRMNNASVMQLDLATTPPPGVYYLQARDAAGGRAFAGRMIFGNAPK